MTGWPLVGRATELQRVGRLLADPGSGGVVIAGPAGAGKTRLAAECAALTDDTATLTVKASATRSSTAIPFGAVSGLLPVDHGSGPPAPDGGGQLIRWIISDLQRRAAGRRLVVVADDAHLLDDASATLLHRLVESRSAFLIAVVGAGEQAPDAVVTLWKDGLVERLDLPGLDKAATQTLLQSVLDGPADGAAIEYFADQSQGNALFLREMVLSALADQTLHNVHGIWRLSGTPSPSARLIEIVESRLRALTDAEREVLEYLALGEPLGPLELDTLLEWAATDRLEKQLLITSRLDGRRLQIRLGHPVYGEVLRSRMSAIRTAEIARDLAGTVEGAGIRRADDVLRVATWRLVGGGGSPELMLRAAAVARGTHDLPLAERLARFAAHSGAGFEAHLQVAQIASLRGRCAEAEEQLAKLAIEATNDDQRCRVALSRLDSAYMGLRPEDHREIAEAAERSVTDPVLHDRIVAHRSWLTLTAEGPRATAALTGPLLERATGAALVSASVPASLALCRLGRIEAALEATTIGSRALESLETPHEYDSWVHVMCRTEAFVRSGRLLEAQALVEGEYSRALAEHAPMEQAHLAWFLANVYHERGLMASSYRLAAEGAASLREQDVPASENHTLVYEAFAAALLGDPVRAGEAISRIESVPGRDATLPPRLLQAKAWTAIAEGDPPRARTHFQEAADVAARTGDLVDFLSAMHGLARIGYPKDALVGLDEVADQVEGELSAARVAHIRALQTMNPAALARVTERFAAIGADLLAAEAAADAATAWLRAGDRRRAASAQRTSATFLERCEGASTPAVQSTQARALLSPAERETALLAARSRSNKQIADELCVSVRTVESRLQHAYAKLGISTREELSSVLSSAVPVSGPGGT